MKICSKCKEEKPLDCFGIDRKSPDGLNYKCRPCAINASNNWMQENREFYLLKKKERYNKNSEKIKESARIYRQNNKGKIKEYARAYAENHKEEILDRAKLYRIKNPEHYKEWRRLNPERHAENNAACARRRRAATRKASGSHTASDVKRIFDSQRGLCANCEIKLFKSGKQKFHVDHIMPLSRGGGNGPDNLQCLCPSCNLRKNAKDPIEWAKENGKLL